MTRLEEKADKYARNNVLRKVIHEWKKENRSRREEWKKEVMAKSHYHYSLQKRLVLEWKGYMSYAQARQKQIAQAHVAGHRFIRHRYFECWLVFVERQRKSRELNRIASEYDTNRMHRVYWYKWMRWFRACRDKILKYRAVDQYVGVKRQQRSLRVSTTKIVRVASCSAVRHIMLDPYVRTSVLL